MGTALAFVTSHWHWWVVALTLIHSARAFFNNLVTIDIRGDRERLSRAIRHEDTATNIASKYHLHTVYDVFLFVELLLAALIGLAVVARFFQ